MSGHKEEPGKTIWTLEREIELDMTSGFFIFLKLARLDFMSVYDLNDAAYFSVFTWKIYVVFPL